MRSQNFAKLGHRDLVLHSDQEPALLDLVNGIIEQRPGQTLKQQSPAYEHASNGVVEKAVQEIEDQVRVLLLSLKHRLGRNVPTTHAVFTWLVEHAADLYIKYHVGKDGKTAVQRLTGRTCREELVEFGEHVMFRPLLSHRAKLQPRWEKGL